jgi:hypothetical protein
MKQLDTLDELTPSATPSPAEIGEWQLLSREEQVRRLRLALNHPDCSIATSDTMDEIRAAAVAEIEAKRRA